MQNPTFCFEKKKNNNKKNWNTCSSSDLIGWYLTLVLLNPDIPCLCKQCRSRSVGFWRCQLIWICTVCHSVCEIMSKIWIEESDWLTIRSGLGILIYSALLGLNCHLRVLDTLGRFATVLTRKNFCDFQFVFPHTELLPKRREAKIILTELHSLKLCQVPLTD